jgi:hypothetical protein
MSLYLIRCTQLFQNVLNCYHREQTPIPIAMGTP